MEVPHRRVGSRGRAPGGAGGGAPLGRGGQVEHRPVIHAPGHCVQVRHLQQRKGAAKFIRSTVKGVF